MLHISYITSVNSIAYTPLLRHLTLIITITSLKREALKVAVVYLLLLRTYVIKAV
jgi:hypothetical protein